MSFVKPITIILTLLLGLSGCMTMSPVDTLPPTTLHQHLSGAAETCLLHKHKVIRQWYQAREMLLDDDPRAHQLHTFYMELLLDELSKLSWCPEERAALSAPLHG